MYNHRLAIKERLEKLLGNSSQVDILNSDFMQNLKEKIVEEFKRDVNAKIRKRISDQMKEYKKSVKTGPAIDDKEIIYEFPQEKKSISAIIQRDISDKLEAIKCPIGKDKLSEEEKTDFSVRIQNYSPKDDHIQEKIKEMTTNLKEQAYMSRQKSVKEKGEPSIYERFVFPLLDEVCLNESKSLDEMYEAANSIIWRTDFIELWMAERKIIDEEEEEKDKELEEREVDISAEDLGQISGGTMLSEIDSDIIEENLISSEQKVNQSIPKLPIEEIKDSANLTEGKEFAKDVKSEEKPELIIPDKDIKVTEETVPEKSVEDKVSSVIPLEEKAFEVVSSVIPLKEEETTSLSLIAERVDDVTPTASVKDEMIPIKSLEEKDIAFPVEYKIIQTTSIEEKESTLPLYGKDAIEIKESLREKEIESVPSITVNNKVTTIPTLDKENEEIANIMQTASQIKQGESSVPSIEESRKIEESLSKECIEKEIKVASPIEENEFGLTKLDKKVNIISTSSLGEHDIEEIKIVEQIISNQDAEKVKSDEKLKQPSPISEETKNSFLFSSSDNIDKDAALKIEETTSAVFFDVIKEDKDIQISSSEEIKNFIPTRPIIISAEIKKEEFTSGLMFNEKEDISRTDEKETEYTSVSESTEIIENISSPVYKNESKDKIPESTGMIIEETTNIIAAFSGELNQAKIVSVTDEIKENNNANIFDNKIKLNDVALSQQFSLQKEKSRIEDKHELSDEINDITASKIYSKKDTSTDFSLSKNDFDVSVKLAEDNTETRLDKISLSDFKNKYEIILTEHDSNISGRVNISAEKEKSKQVIVDDLSNIENNLARSLIENEKEITTSFSQSEITTSDLIIHNEKDQTEVITEDEISLVPTNKILESEILSIDTEEITKNTKITDDLTDLQSEKSKKNLN